MARIAVYSVLLVSLEMCAGILTCPLQFVGNVKQFIVEQENGNNRRTVPAVERAMTADAFYNYYSYSSHTGFEEVDTSVMFLYRDLNHVDDLSFFWFHGIDEGHGPTVQGEARVDGLVTQIPNGVTIVQRDDHAGEWEWTSSAVLGGPLDGMPPNIAGKWSFRRNTDGGAIKGLPINENWEMKIETNFILGINTWKFFFGDGSTPQVMDTAEPVYLRPVVTSVDLGVAPYPQVAASETFCTLVTSDVSNEVLTYTFIWGDDTPDTVVMLAEGNLACADHDFCGPISGTCGGTSPRKVRVLVEKTGCDGIERVLADEDVNTCPALQFVGSVKQFIVEQEEGKNRRTVPAVERAMTADTFYDYRSASSHTGFEKTGRSIMFLYRNLLDATSLSFFWIHGIDDGQGQPSQPESTVDGLLTGVPTSAYIVQSDDSTSEWDETSSTTIGTLTHSGPHVGGNWWFKSNTDGGAIAGLPLNENWEMRIDAVFHQGIDEWFFYFGDGSMPQEMDPAEPVFLKPVITTVDLGVTPYPQTPGFQTFCTLVESDPVGEELTYTFMWGDGTPNTVVTLMSGELACAEHYFCGPVSGTCGGIFPRKVHVIVEKTGCDGIERILAEESTGCDDGNSGFEVSAGGSLLTGVQLTGQEAFSNSNVELTKIPELMQNMFLHIPTAPLPSGNVLNLKCCGPSVCEFIVSHYHCPPCSSKENGGFPGILPLSGFESGSCAPKYGPGAERMTSFRIQVQPGQQVTTLPTTEDASSYVVFAQLGAIEADPWCPKNKVGCGGPCPPNICVCPMAR